MSQNINLTEISKGKTYLILGFENHPSEYTEKLHKMGFVEGTPIELAPVHLWGLGSNGTENRVKQKISVFLL